MAQKQTDKSGSRNKPLCPTCGKRFEMEKTPAPPFCSDRCRLVDLGRWLDEGIAIQSVPDESPKTIDPDLTR